MFEEVCLACGKHLTDDVSAYCSDDCARADVVSPSMSSASSAWSSPQIGHAHGSDVPALVPSALGSALNRHHGHDHYSVSSSSASSTSWSALTSDEDDDDAQVGGDDENADADLDGASKSLGPTYGHHRDGLSYARRPASTNIRSTIPLLHRRTSSGSQGRDGGVPGSAPSLNLSPEGDLDDTSAPSSPSRDVPLSESQRDKHSSTVTGRSKRKHNRASLPAYFSLLQINSSPHKGSPMSSSSVATAARSSPPTPKLAGMSGSFSQLAQPSLTASVIYAGVEGTPRGGRKDASRSGRRSRSRSTRELSKQLQPLGTRDNVEQASEWSSGTAAPRGRTTVRRNSSPPAKMARDDVQLEVRSGSRTRTRGRIRADELDNPPVAYAPGFGSGRSGLKHRERDHGRAW